MNTLKFKDRFVNANTLEIDGVDTQDYPDFCDAYFDYAEYTNGVPLTEDELVDFQEEHLDLLNEMAFESLL